MVAANMLNRWIQDVYCAQSIGRTSVFIYCICRLKHWSYFIFAIYFMHHFYLNNNLLNKGVISDSVGEGLQYIGIRVLSQFVILWILWFRKWMWRACFKGIRIKTWIDVSFVVSRLSISGWRTSTITNSFRRNTTTRRVSFTWATPLPTGSFSTW